MHSVPALSNHVELEKNGIPGLLSAKAFDIAYTQYHAHILDELNAVTQGAYHPPTRALLSK
jgi:Fe-Mn family superoxide dismutase